MNIHVIIGADDYLVDQTARKVIGENCGLEVIDSANATNAELQLADLVRAEESLLTPPFLEPRKVTWWKNVAFLPGGKSSEDVKTALERFGKRLSTVSLPENQHFILSGPHLLKTSLFAKALQTCAEVVVFATGKPKEEQRNATARAIDYAREAGLVFAPGAAEKFVAIVGTDARSTISELMKMRDYLPSGCTTIAAADIDAITSPGVGVEPLPWDVTNAVGCRDISAALEALRKFELVNGFAVFMTGVIERFFRQLLDISAGRTENLTPWAVTQGKGFLKNWSVRELREAWGRFVLLREKVVSGLTSGDVLVVSTLVRVMRRRRPR